MEITKEKSEEQAFVLALINGQLRQLDVDYLAECAKALRERAFRYDTLAVLNADWSPEGGKVLDSQATALESLVQYIRSLQAVDAAKGDQRVYLGQREKMAQLFNL